MGHALEVRSVTPLPDGRLASCSDDMSIKVWGLSKLFGWQSVATLKGHTAPVFSVTVLADGRLVSGSEEKTIKV